MRHDLQEAGTDRAGSTSWKWRWTSNIIKRKRFRSNLKKAIRVETLPSGPNFYSGSAQCETGKLPQKFGTIPYGQWLRGCNIVEVEVEVNLQPTVSLGVRRPSGTCDQFVFLLEISFRQLRVCYFVAPSLARGQVCNLLVQLLLGLARAVTLGPKSRRTHGYILLSHLRLAQPGGPGSRIYILQEQGGPVIPPGTGFPLCRLLRLAG
jgi:hypothetical protein